MPTDLSAIAQWNGRERFFISYRVGGGGRLHSPSPPPDTA
jgi:hypothetical protein